MKSSRCSWRRLDETNVGMMIRMHDVVVNLFACDSRRPRIMTTMALMLWRFHYFLLGSVRPWGRLNGPLLWSSSLGRHGHEAVFCGGILDLGEMLLVLQKAKTEIFLHFHR